MSNPSGKVERITPTTAKQWLKKMPKNRRIRPAKLKKLVNIIRNDEWKVTGDSIRFNEKGELIDGQHRLTAIIETGVSKPCFVVRGLDEDVFPYIDTGAGRSLNDVLGMEGEKNYVHVATALRVVGAVLKNKTGSKFSIKGEVFHSHAQAVKFLESHKGLRRSVDFAKSNSSDKIVSPGYAAGLHYLFSRAGGAEWADEYMEGVLTGVNLKKTDPGYVVRKKLIKNSHEREKKMTRESIVCTIIKGWNLFLQDEEYPPKGRLSNEDLTAQIVKLEG